MSKNNSEPSRVAPLLQKLCIHISGRRKEESLPLLKRAVSILTNAPIGSTKIQDEFYITEHIKKKLSQIRSEKDVYTFTDLHRKLQGLPKKNRQAVLLFLMNMSEKPAVSNSSSSQSVSDLIASSSSDSSTTVSQKASPQDSALFGLPKLLPSSHTSTPESGFQMQMRTSNSTESWHQGNRENLIRRMPGSQTMISPMSSDARISRQTSITQFGTEISESQLLQELIYAFQGIDGKYLKLCPRTHGYKLDPKVRLKCSVRQYVLRLAELGWLHNQVRQICENASISKPQGLIANSLIAALREELTEHYRLVAVLQAQIQQQLDMLVDSPLSEEQPPSRHEGLTLRRLAVWTMEPEARMKCLVAVANACKDKKGGALASCVHGFLQHGDPVVRDTVKFLLGSVCRPMYVMLSHWILDGELEDPYGEFFIAANLDVKGDRLWHDKYCVLESMVPSFISLAQARKILATGKSINFLREVCRDHTPVKGRDLLKRTLESTSVEALFMSDKDGDLHAMMDTAYLETSRRVLDVLTGQYKFLDHLQALRRYLLLGQGDFIRHLMELLEPELLKPSNQLYPHNLSGILESAVRATNAQFEDSDILKRLDVQLFEHSGGETGWDVFALTYHVAGPIGTIFSNDTTSYLTLFFALWKAKRMEWILSQMWKRQMTSSKWLRKLPELRSVLHQVHLLTSEMVHFIHQMQYYILFEVLECSWDVLIKKVQQAESLDDIIAAHEHFLQTVKAGALLDANSQDLASHLDHVYKFILQLQDLEGKLHDRALSELELRTQQETVIEERGEFGEFGISEEEEQLHNLQIQDFQNKFIPSVAAKLKSTSESYQDTVKKFLLSLASQTDVSLQLLSFRLDFNEHYKRLDSRLTAPLTYQHRRLSEMGLGRGSPSAMSQARIRGK